MKTVLFFIYLVFSISGCLAENSKPVVYLIPGQGADGRLFKNLVVESTFEVRPIEYFTPEEGWTMEDFARELATQIDTTGNYSIVGVSLGGMLATEMTDFLHPDKVIIISSAKSRNELPARYRFQKTIPVYKMVPKGVLKSGAKTLQPIVEHDREEEAETFDKMLEDKDPLFLKRTLEMILSWERTTYNKNIVHLHGDADHTIPIKNVQYTYLIEDGSHMMVLTRAEEISKLLNQILEGKTP